MYIYTIASGKGGVGKSLFSINLAICLAKMDKKVIIADLDLGGSNIHLMISIAKRVNKGIGSFLLDNSNIESIIIKTDYKNLYFIPGDNEIPGLANITTGQKKKLINSLLSLDADYLIIDLGAGSSYNTLDFFLISNDGIIISTPNPTAMVNSYLFLKNILFRLLSISFKKNSLGYKHCEKIKKDSQKIQRINFLELKKELSIIDKDNYIIFNDYLESLNIGLVFNMIENPKDTIKAKHLKNTCKSYLDLDLNHLGVIYRDELQNIALNSKIPITIYKPNSILSQSIYRIAEKILTLEEDKGTDKKQKIVLSFDDIIEEAESDFNNRLDYVQDLIDNKALSISDLIEMLKNQQTELDYLKKQNLLYKDKLLKAVKNGFNID